jgi:cell division protein FtsI/penicillin-binding protein 2
MTWKLQWLFFVIFVLFVVKLLFVFQKKQIYHEEHEGHEDRKQKKDGVGSSTDPVCDSISHALAIYQKTP